MIKGLFFDLNGTLIDIFTSENDENVYRVTANFLSYYGVYIQPEKLRELYFEYNRQQRHGSSEEFPEFDVEQIFSRIIGEYHSEEFPADVPAGLAGTASVVFRAASRFKLELYPEVRKTLDILTRKYFLAAVSDGQSLWAEPEMRASGLGKFFQRVVVSGNYGFRKPDPRMYQLALERLGLRPDEVIFIGNDMLRDVYGAKNLGMKTVFFKSNQGDHDFHGVEPDYIIYNFNELLRAVEFLEKQVR